jgi:PAS domain-containing protein
LNTSIPIKKRNNDNTDSYIEERIKHLEGVERFVIDSLEVAASLGDFQSSINKLSDVTAILAETGIKIQGLIPFETVAFFLVEEESNYFSLRHIDSANHRSYVQSEVDNAIEDGIFAWALREKRPVVVPTKDRQKSLVLHSMTTMTRICGMFVGILNNDTRSILNISLSLVSFILFNSANAIESFELYRRIREISRSLERIDNYRLLFEAAPDGVEVVDTEGNIIDCNDSQKKLLGYSREQLTGSRSSNY